MKFSKIIKLLFLLLVTSCISDKSSRTTDLEKLKLNGTVKSYIKTIHKSLNESKNTTEIKLKEQFRELLEFNENGNIIEKVSYKKNGERYKKWISIYDDNGDEIKGYEIKYPNDTLKRWTSKYDKLGNKIESLIYDGKDSLLSHNKSTFNKFNKKTESKILKSKKVKNQLVKVSFNYDNNGNQIKRTNHYKDNSKTEWFTKYDSSGNETEWTVYDRNGNLERIDSTNYIYYKNGEIKEEEMFSSVDGPDVYGISKYDENGDEIEYTEYLNDSITSKEIYIYESNSQTTKYFNSSGELKTTIKLISEFDNIGNLIKESEYENEILKIIKKYKIEYYK